MGCCCLKPDKDQYEQLLSDGPPPTGDFPRDTLNLHNVFRRLHGATELTLDAACMEHAAQCATRMAKEGQATRCNDRGVGAAAYGESFYVCDGPRPTAKAVVMAWYGEGVHYNFDHPAYTKEAEHFTQVVWADTRTYGIAMEEGADGRWYVCANYHPTGNYFSYSRNVQEAKGKKK